MAFLRWLCSEGPNSSLFFVLAIVTTEVSNLEPRETISAQESSVCLPSMGGMRKPERSGRVLTAEAWVVADGKMYIVADEPPSPARIECLSIGE